MSRLWITWERQRRNRSTSSALNADLFEVDIKGNSYIRYIKSLYLSAKKIISQKPTLLFVQNPSIVLATLANLLGLFTHIKIIVDAHNAGIYPSEGRNILLNMLARWIIKNSDLTIVTNNVLSNYVESIGGNSIVLPDPLPEFHNTPTSPKKLKGTINLLFICSWADDEPYLELIDAAKIISPNTTIYMTGNWKKCGRIFPESLPANVVLTGFISDDEFDSLLFSCDLIIDLTNRDNCLVCGAYEAIAAEKPLLLSDTPVLRSYFDKATVFTKNDSESIAYGIAEAVDNIVTLQKESIILKSELINRWEKHRENLEEKILKL